MQPHVYLLALCACLKVSLVQGRPPPSGPPATYPTPPRAGEQRVEQSQGRRPPEPYAGAYTGAAPPSYEDPRGQPPQAFNDGRRMEQRPQMYPQQDERRMGGYPPVTQGGNMGYEAPGLLSRLASKLKGDDAEQQQYQQPQHRPSAYGGWDGPQQQQQRPDQQLPSQSYLQPQQQQRQDGPRGQQQSPYQRPMQQQQQQYPPPRQAGGGWNSQALTPVGPPRGPLGAAAGQGGGYGQQISGQGQGQEGGLWDRIKGRVFHGDNDQQGGSTSIGPPSFRPKGSTLKKTAAGQPAYNSPFPGYHGGPMMGAEHDAGLESPASPPLFLSVDDSIVFILKPTELEKKKRKFVQAGLNRLQVIANFDHCLTRFMDADGSRACLKTTELLEQSQVLLPEAAKRIRYLRNEFRRRMQAEGKDMSYADKTKALEEHVRKIYATAALEGGAHMSSIGPAVESSSERIPLRDGAAEMLEGLAFRGVPLTIYCAGYGNVVLEVIKHGVPKVLGPSGAFNPNIRIIANFFQVDETMTIVGMYDAMPLVHEANKNANTIVEFFRKAGMDVNLMASRPNVVLLGTDISDAGLLQDLPGKEESISIGFLKMDADFLQKLPRYAQVYDAVVLGDGDLSFVNEILYELAS